MGFKQKVNVVKSGALCALVMSGAFAAFAANGGMRLIMNGKTASYDVRTIGGKTYIPIGDVAKALGMSVVKNGQSWEIKKAGGTFQVGDLDGKIGDVLYDGKWRFQVLDITMPEWFKMRTDASPYDHWSVSNYDTPTRTFTPKDGYKLVVVKVRVTNTLKVPQTMWTAISDKALRTALTDTDGESFPPIDYDYEGGPTVTKAMLPGSNMTFPIIFSLRNDAVLKDLIFTLKNNDSFAKGNDARVLLRK